VDDQSIHAICKGAAVVVVVVNALVIDECENSNSIPRQIRIDAT